MRLEQAGFNLCWFLYIHIYPSMSKRAMKPGDITADQDLTIQKNIIAINSQIFESVSIKLTTTALPIIEGS